MNIQEKIENIICEILGKDVKIDYDANLMYDYNMDSIQIMNVVVELENQFDIEFELEELDIENLVHFSRLVEQVQKLIGEEKNN